MRFVLAVLFGLLACGLLGQVLDPHLPAQWAWIIGGLAGFVVGRKVYQWMWRRV